MRSEAEHNRIFGVFNGRLYFLQCIVENKVKKEKLKKVVDIGRKKRVQFNGTSTVSPISSSPSSVVLNALSFSTGGGGGTSMLEGETRLSCAFKCPFVFWPSISGDLGEPSSEECKVGNFQLRFIEPDRLWASELESCGDDGDNDDDATGGKCCCWWFSPATAVSSASCGTSNLTDEDAAPVMGWECELIELRAGAGMDERLAVEAYLGEEDESGDLGDWGREVWDIDWCRLKPDEGWGMLGAPR